MGILIEEGNKEYVARLKQLPRAQGATRGDPDGGVPAGVYIFPATRAATNSYSITPRSSSLGALHGNLAIRLSLAKFGGQQQKEDGEFYTG